MEVESSEAASLGVELDAGKPATRVLICIPTLGSGGAERQIRLLAPQLVSRGIQVSLFSRLARADVEALTASGVACHPIRSVGNHNPLLALEIVRAAKAAEAQIIHTWLTQMDILGGVIALATRRRWILSERNSMGAYSDRAKDRLRAWLGRFADAVVANSISGLDVWPHHPSRIMIRNGVDHEAIQHAPLKALDGRAGDSGRTIIVSVARLAKEKRIDKMLHALSRLRLEIADVLLVLVGEGPEERALKALAAELGVDDHVLFAGFQPDAWSWIKSGSVFLSSSLFEGQSNAVLEAAAAGTPQVLSDIGMHRNAVGDGGAVFIDPDDPEALASAVVSLVRNSEMARSVASVARNAVLGLSVERAADLYAQLYRRVASGGPLGADCETGAQF
jgi:glycosyltransferase involved in cell wall biosynthesis